MDSLRGPERMCGALSGFRRSKIPVAWRRVPGAGCSILVKMTETLTGPQLLDIRRMIVAVSARMTVGEGTELTVVNWKDGRGLRAEDWTGPAARNGC
ncbi:hypothetical protein [Burkholderia cenocepacia]|uniref:hypothetical protein n=1 Tax=Burkholderia cenocepacia TaxID=95486 RepID=UPI001908FC9D|nr:hypothetical protein [Burkholderia cenocepacia]MBJ9696954.1 hypothetical protein [Burkholderia cenocepacia]